MIIKSVNGSTIRTDLTIPQLEKKLNEKGEYIMLLSVFLTSDKKTVHLESIQIKKERIENYG